MDPTSAVTTALRERGPLVQCLTNFVSMDLAANVLSAAGASPAMVHDPHESAELAGLAGAVCVNIGTPSPRWADGMRLAAERAGADGTPWVLDPVAVGATAYRRALVADLLTLRPTVVRGNAGEVLALAGTVGGSRGVDSLATSDDASDAAAVLAREHGCVVVVSGEVDVVTDGTRTLHVHGGHPWMPMITALGCSSSALVAAACAVVDDPLEAAAGAMGLLAAAGADAAGAAEGPASLRVALVDRLASPDRLDLASRVRAADATSA
jgi:hydroxyethylthiazole kinase